MTEYVLQDRTLSIKWALNINDGELNYFPTEDSSSRELVFYDGSNYYILFISDGEIGIELTLSEEYNDLIELEDSSGDGVIWRLCILDGQLNYFTIVQILKIVYMGTKEYLVQNIFSEEYNEQEIITEEQEEQVISSEEYTGQNFITKENTEQTISIRGTET